MKIVIAGGGTGGHIFPAAAVVEYLKASGYEIEVSLVGTRKGLERQIAPRIGYTPMFILAKALPRKLGPGILVSLLVTFIGFLQSLVILAVHRPNVIVATGGYASAPCILAGKLLGTPIIMMEPNVIPGRTTRLLAGFVDEVALGFSEAVKYFKKGTNLRVTGIPTRLSLFDEERQGAIAELGLEFSRRTVFIFGGSRGASSINEAFLEAASHFEYRDDVQFIVQTGEADYGRISREIQSRKIVAKIFAFIDDIGKAYAMSDIVVSRAGAATIAEITALGLPSILIPYPHAVAGHQQANADVLAKHGAAIVIPDRELTGKRLASAIEHLLNNPYELQQMAQRASDFGNRDAAREVAEDILSLVKHKGRLSRLAAIIGEICSVR